MRTLEIAAKRENLERRTIIMSKLTITKKQENETLNVTVAGRVDTGTAPNLNSEVEKSIGGVKKIVLNFEKVEYISSSGLRVLLSLHKTIIANGGELIIRKPIDTVIEVFDVTGFTDILNIEK